MKDPLNHDTSMPQFISNSRLDKIRLKLENAGLILTRSNRLPNQTGHQLRFATGEIVNLFDTGTVTVQGKNQAHVRQLLGLNDLLKDPHAEH